MANFSVQEDEEEFTGSETHIWRFLDGDKEVVEVEMNRDMRMPFNYILNEASGIGTQDAKKILEQTSYQSVDLLHPGQNTVEDSDGEQVIFEYGNGVRVGSNGMPYDLLTKVVAEATQYSSSEIESLLEFVEEKIT